MREPVENDIFWGGGGRGEILDRLCLAGRGLLFAVAPAPPGSGVSHLLGTAAMELVDGAIIARLDGARAGGTAGIMQALQTSLGAGQDNLSRVLNETLQRQRLVLLVDNAESLAEQEIDALARLHRRLGSAFAVILGGTEPMEQALTERRVHAEAFRLRPLNSQQGAEFLAEVTGTGPDPEALPRLMEKTGGWPGALLEEAGTGSAPVLIPGVPWKHIAAIVGLALVVWMLWPREEVDHEARPLELPEAPVRSEAPSGQAQRPTETGSGPAPVPGPEASEPEPEPEPEPEAEPEREDQEEAAAAGIVSGATPELTGTEAEFGYRREDWLLAASADQWMLQVTLASTEDAARVVADRIGRDRAAYYRAHRDGSLAYIVLAGPWDSVEAAREGRTSLPAEVRRTGPFPRPMEEIQAEIDE